MRKTHLYGDVWLLNPTAEGVQNAYFPLLIPLSFISREAEHVDGFAKECAIVTHHRLEKGKDGGLVPAADSELEEPLIIRPTSETIIGDSMSNWIQSYRDLPLLLNQWCNVMRWEMRTRLFLRTSEFLWQEGHTAHASKAEAIEEAEKMLDVYAEFAENILAMPVIKGIKTANERFAGAEETYCIEALMQDGKALQAGTSHFLGQNFAKAFEVKFTGKDGKLDYVWATSWGVSTRLMGALIMTHSDDSGLVLPPMVAPIQVIIVPIYRTDEEQEQTIAAGKKICEELKNAGIRAKLDDKDTQKPGWKFAEYELKGVPLRIAVGPRDLANQSVELARRDLAEKSLVPMEGLTERISGLLAEIQNTLFNKAKQRLIDNTRNADDYETFKTLLDGPGGFISAHWDGTPETEESIKAETKATIRCIPLDAKEEAGVCIYSGKPSSKRVLFARAY